MLMRSGLLHSGVSSSFLCMCIGLQSVISFTRAQQENRPCVVTSVFIYNNKQCNCAIKITLILTVWCFAELEKKFKNNEQRMQRQRTELDELRVNATQVRDEIREQVQKYSNCVL